MNSHPETVLLAWTRDADGGCQRFSGEDIYARVGRWCMDRLRRDIPTIATYHCYLDGHHFINSIAAVP